MEIWVIFFFILSVVFGLIALYYNGLYNEERKPFIEISYIEMQKLATEEMTDFDKIGLATTQINKTVDMNNVPDYGLVIYRQWLYGEFKKVKKIISKKVK